MFFHLSKVGKIIASTPPSCSKYKIFISPLRVPLLFELKKRKAYPVFFFFTYFNLFSTNLPLLSVKCIIVCIACNICWEVENICRFNCLLFYKASKQKKSSKIILKVFSKLTGNRSCPTRRHAIYVICILDSNTWPLTGSGHLSTKCIHAPDTADFLLGMNFQPFSCCWYWSFLSSLECFQ